MLINATVAHISIIIVVHYILYTVPGQVRIQLLSAVISYSGTIDLLHSHNNVQRSYIVAASTSV